MGFSFYCVLEEGWPIRVHFVGVGYYTTCAFVSACFFFSLFFFGEEWERSWVLPSLSFFLKKLFIYLNLILFNLNFLFISLFF
jgi:hypothetical protein